MPGAYNRVQTEIAMIQRNRRNTDILRWQQTLEITPYTLSLTDEEYETLEIYKCWQKSQKLIMEKNELRNLNSVL
jgi:hypothetical protein